MDTPDNKPSPKHGLQQAQDLLAAGRLARAARLTQQRLTEHPDDAEALGLLAIIAARQGAMAQAEHLLQRAVRCAPEDATLCFNLAKILAQQDKLAEAIAGYQEAARLQPKMTAAWMNLGNLHLRLHQYREATESYRRVVELAPEHAGAWRRLGNAYAGTQQAEEARACYQRAMALAPDRIEGFLDMAELQRHAGETQAAAETLREAIRAHPASFAAHTRLADLLAQTGDDRAAVGHYQQVLAYEPEDVDALLGLARCQSRQGDLDAALTTLGRAAAAAPDTGEVYRSRAAVRVQLGQSAEALADFKTAVRLSPDSAMAHVDLAHALAAAGQSDAAIDAYQAALALNPYLAAAWYMYVKALRQARRAADPEVIDRIERLIEDERVPADDRHHLYFSLASLYEDRGEDEQAFRYFALGNSEFRKGYTYDIERDRRYFRRITAAFGHKLYIKHMGAGGAAEAGPIFILGMPRSGTSLVEMILASHPEIRAAGELELLGDLAVNRAVEHHGDRFPEYVGRLQPQDLRALGTQYLQDLRRRHPDGRYVTDKMPHNFLYLGLIRLILPQAKVIHCRRDPVANCVSIYREAFSGDHPYAYDLRELGRYYRLYHELMAHWRRVLPGFFFEVDYEALVADQEAQTRALLAYCGLPWDERCLRFYEADHLVDTASVGQVRQRLYTTSVAGWRRYRNHLQPLLEALGPLAPPEGPAPP